MTFQNPVIVNTQMLIRKPVSEVFRAFIDPAVTTRFWFTKSSGKLEPGKEVRWDWEMYGASASINVKAADPNHRIVIEWDEPPRVVEWVFTPRADHTLWSASPSRDSAEARRRWPLEPSIRWEISRWCWPASKRCSSTTSP